jgi:hypothetical protein
MRGPSLIERMVSRGPKRRRLAVAASFLFVVAVLAGPLWR